MSHIQSYEMNPREGCARALIENLLALASELKGVPGSAGAMVLEDNGELGRVLFLEFWANKESRQAAAPHLPHDLMTEILSQVSCKPINGDWRLLNSSRSPGHL